MRINVRSPSNLSWVIKLSPMRLFQKDNVLKFIRQANSGHRQQQSRNHACSNISACTKPFAIFQHFRGFPSETGKSGETSKKSDSDGHAHVRGDQYAVHRQLADQSQQETAGQIHKQRPVRESAAHSNLHHALQPIARQRADGSEQCNQEYFQAVTSPPVSANQHKARRPWYGTWELLKNGNGSEFLRSPGVDSSSVCRQRYWSHRGGSVRPRCSGR